MVMPVLYNTTHSSPKRVSVMIATVWVLAFAVSCPLLFGFNTTGEFLYSVSPAQLVDFDSKTGHSCSYTGKNNAK